MKLTIIRTVTTVRKISVEQGKDSKEEIQRIVALGVNALGFDNVGEFKSEDADEYVDDINIDSLI